MSEIGAFSQGELRNTIAMKIYKQTNFSDDEFRPLERSYEIADAILFEVGQSHSFRCKDCGLEHLIDSNGNWRALKPSPQDGPLQ